MLEQNVTDFLVLDKIVVNYGGQLALPSLSLQIRAGEFFCLLGPSGCGKTTTLNVVAGFVGVSTGKVILDGRDITNLPPQRRAIGVVFQSYALFPHMTAAQNVGYGLSLRKRPNDEIQRSVGDWLSMVGLKGKGGRYPKELSGGEQQRVAIARALAIQPDLLLLDEPLSNLDARLREGMRAELKRIQKATGVTTVFVTHDQEEAFGAGDRIAVLNQGVVEQVGSPTEIYRRPVSSFVAGFIGRSNRLQGTYKKAERAIVVGGRTIAVAAGFKRDLANATLYIRPEELTLGATATQCNSIAGKIDGLMYGGSTLQYRVTAPIGDLEVCQLAGGDPYVIGDNVVVSWSESSGIVLDNGDM